MNIKECPQCGKPTIAREFVVFTYWYQPWLAWVAHWCIRCDHKETWWLGPWQWEAHLEYLTELGSKFVIADFATDNEVQKYAKSFDLELLTSRDLTPREEHRVSFFAYLLERVTIQEEL